MKSILVIDTPRACEDCVCCKASGSGFICGVTYKEIENVRADRDEKRCPLEEVYIGLYEEK